MIVAFQGGLGNQMFQYAFGRSVSAARNEELFFTRDRVDNDPKRCYSLGVFNPEISFVPELKEPIYGEPVFQFDPGVYTAVNGSSFVGHWQTEKYFDKNLVRKIFAPPNHFSPETMAVAREIVKYENSAFVHVRRTDYLVGPNPEFHGNLGSGYYAEAAIRLPEGTHFFVFSDDPDYCRQHFNTEQATVVGHNKAGDSDGPGTEHEDLFLMAMCRHAIIANSSFSWWGAWLGDTQRDRIVIAPKIWFKNPGMSYHDVAPDRWIKI